MALWRRCARGLRVLLNRAAADRDIADEIDQFVDEAVQSLEASGLSRDEATRVARAQIGSMTVAHEQVRGYGWEHTIESVVAHLRYGLRQLHRRPRFAFLCSLTLALGIGASTASSSAVKPVLFRPLPYPAPHRLMMIWDAQNGVPLDVTFGTYRELVERTRTFD